VPFALLGAGRRSWWVAAALVAIAAVPLVQLWFDYIKVVQNSAVDLGYSIASYPLLLAPVIASSDALTAGLRNWLAAQRAGSKADQGAPGGKTSPEAS
jgi:hypothetical protein